MVQVYRSDLDYTFKTEKKLLPKWSQRYRIRTQIRNSYTLERLNGEEVEGEFSARRLRKFIPREGSWLEKEQREQEEEREQNDHHTLPVNAVRTPLFARGGHGIGREGQGGQRSRDETEAEERDR